MSTHALPAGTVNFPVNMPKELRLAAGRFADRIAGMSLGRWIRGLRIVIRTDETGVRIWLQSTRRAEK